VYITACGHLCTLCCAAPGPATPASNALSLETSCWQQSMFVSGLSAACEASQNSNWVQRVQGITGMKADMTGAREAPAFMGAGGGSAAAVAERDGGGAASMNSQQTAMAPGDERDDRCACISSGDLKTESSGPLMSRVTTEQKRVGFQPAAGLT